MACATCGPGFFHSSGICLKCSSRCLTCSDASTCGMCEDGFTLNGGTACTKCTSPCLTCSTSPTTCTSCIRPYYLGGSNNCRLCTAANCDSCSADGTQCVNCLRPFSRLPNAGVCYQCSSPLCYHCNSANTSQCL